MSASERLGLSRLRAQLGGAGPGALLARGTATAFALGAAGTLIVFGNQVLLARILGAQSYGQYVYVVTWLGLLVVLSAAGLNHAAVRFVAEYTVRREWAKLHGFLTRSTQITILVSVMVSVGLIAIVISLRPRLSAGLDTVFLIGAAVLPAWSALEVLSASLRGLKRILSAQGPPLVLRPLLFATALIALYFLFGAVTAPAAMLANLAITVAVLAVMAVLQRRALAEAWGAKAEYRSREWLAVSVPLLLTTGFGIVLRSTDTIMLGAYRGTTDAGIYTVAGRAAMFVPFMLGAVNTMSAPMISEYYSARDGRRLQRTLTVGAMAALGFGAIAGLALAVFGRTLLGLFGPEFLAAYIPLLILVGAQVVTCLAGSAGPVMTMTGHQNATAVILGLTALLNILLNVWLIPTLGLLGAAIATAISVITWNVAMMTFVIRRLRLNPSVIPVGLLGTTLD